MKGFFDIWFLARTFPLAAGALGDAIRSTFERRATRLDADSVDISLTDLSGDPSKQTQWRAFIQRTGIEMPDAFPAVVVAIRQFSPLPCGPSRLKRKQHFTGRPVDPGGPRFNPDQRRLGEGH